MGEALQEVSIRLEMFEGHRNLDRGEIERLNRLKGEYEQEAQAAQQALTRAEQEAA